MTNELTKLLQEQCADLINANAAGISDELSSAAEGKLTVSVSARLVLIGRRIVCQTAISYSRKFKDEIEGVAELPDEKQEVLKIE